MQFRVKLTHRSQIMSVRGCCSPLFLAESSSGKMYGDDIDWRDRGRPLSLICPYTVKSPGQIPLHFTMPCIALFTHKPSHNKHLVSVINGNFYSLFPLARKMYPSHKDHTTSQFLGIKWINTNYHPISSICKQQKLNGNFISHPPISLFNFFLPCPEFFSWCLEIFTQQTFSTIKQETVLHVCF